MTVSSRELGHDTGRAIAITALTSVLYFVFAQVGFWVALDGTQASPIWFPSGIALVAAMMYGRTALPGIYVGALVANLTWFVGPSWAGLAESALIAVGNTAEAYVAYRLLRAPRYGWRMMDFWIYVMVASVACLVAALNGPLWVVVFDVEPLSMWVPMALTWWVGDMIGMMAFTPLVLHLMDFRR
jgi:integral membrane sensor domain MASE1